MNAWTNFIKKRPVRPALTSMEGFIVILARYLLCLPHVAHWLPSWPSHPHSAWPSQSKFNVCVRLFLVWTPRYKAALAQNSSEWSLRCTYLPEKTNHHCPKILPQKPTKTRLDIIRGPAYRVYLDTSACFSLQPIIRLATDKVSHVGQTCLTYYSL